MAPISTGTTIPFTETAKVASVASPPGTFHQTNEGLSDNPLKRTWRGDAAGKLRLPTEAPDFGGDKLKERQWIKVGF